MLRSPLPPGSLSCRFSHPASAAKDSSLLPSLPCFQPITSEPCPSQLASSLLVFIFCSQSAVLAGSASLRNLLPYPYTGQAPLLPPGLHPLLPESSFRWICLSPQPASLPGHRASRWSRALMPSPPSPSLRSIRSIRRSPSPQSLPPLSLNTLSLTPPLLALTPSPNTPGQCGIPEGEAEVVLPHQAHHSRLHLCAGQQGLGPLYPTWPAMGQLPLPFLRSFHLLHLAPLHLRGRLYELPKRHSSVTAMTQTLALDDEGNFALCL